MYNVGKVGWTVTKTAGDVAWNTGKAIHHGARTVVYLAKGKQIIPLERQNNNLYADVVLNRKVKAKFMVDTGASNMQISQSMARRLNIDMSKAQPTKVSVAGGHLVDAYAVTLDEVRMGGARVRDVRAIVLAEDRMGLKDGLIGMSFLNNFDFNINPQKPELVLQQKE